MFIKINLDVNVFVIFSGGFFGTGRNNLISYFVSTTNISYLTVFNVKLKSLRFLFIDYVFLKIGFMSPNERYVESINKSSV